MNALHPLGQLIQSVEDTQGWSIREIARRTASLPKGLSHTHVAVLKSKPLSSVTYESIQALAVGLGVPERVVGLAALESMGVHDVDPTEIGAAASIARAPDLTERDRRILLAAVREMQRGQDDEQQQDPPGERAGDPSERGGVARPPVADGVTANGAGERQDDYDLAADTGISKRVRMDAEAARRGEGSQDPGHDEPA